MKILISDINIMLHDANSNALEGGGGGYHPSVRMVLDRGGGGGVSGPPKKCYILFECSLYAILPII